MIYEKDATMHRQAADPSDAPAPASRKEGRFHCSFTTDGRASYLGSASYLANATDKYAQMIALSR